MNCREACRLIDYGIQPGSHTPQTARLGFHLAICPSCRTYRATHQALLEGLLLETAIPPETNPSSKDPVTRQQPVTQTVAHPRHGSSLTRWVWIISIILFVALPISTGLWILGVIQRAKQNISAMVVTTAPPANVLPSRTAVLPTKIPPLPSITADSASSGHVAMLARRVFSPGNQIQPTPTTTDLVMSATAILLTTPSSTLPATSTPLATETPLTSSEAVTILLLGNDRRPGEQGIPRTDTLMLLRVDPERNRIALLSLPRDLWAEIPGYGAARINAAYVWGELYGAPNGGMGLTRDTIGNMLGISIDYVVMVDFEGFISLIDTIGIITVNVEKELYDDRFPTMDYGYTTVHFRPGLQQMDGATALTYSRIRHPDSDFMRIRRQQAVVMAIGERLRERGDFQNILSVDQITASLVGFVLTDMPKERILDMIWTMRDFDALSVERYTIGEHMVSFGVGDDRYAMIVAPETLAQMGRIFIEAP